MGYAVTATIGLALEGDFEIGWDDTFKKFLVKVKASAACGPGFGGGFEFSIGVGNLLHFIHFVYAQLNNHNFSWVDLMDQRTFERLSILIYELAKQGKVIQAAGAAAVYVIGQAALPVLKNIDTLRDAWYEMDDAQTTANKLVEFIEKNPTLVQHLVPEVKGRMLHVLCEGTAFFTDDKAIELAILKVLSTVASLNDYHNILDSMRIPQQGEKSKAQMTPAELTTHQKQKSERRKKNEERLSWVLDNVEKKKFIQKKDGLQLDAAIDFWNQWLKKLPKIAAPL